MPSAQCTVKAKISSHNSQYVSYSHLKGYLEGRFGTGLDFGEKVRSLEHRLKQY
jgi:hypothetical protein